VQRTADGFAAEAAAELLPHEANQTPRFQSHSNRYGLLKMPARTRTTIGWWSVV
jgi:hypothetical protein